MNRNSEWLDNAICKGTPIDWWFYDHRNLTPHPEAANLCNKCPVHPECLHDALATPRTEDEHGYRAGTTPADRRRIRRRTRQRAA